MWTFLYSLTWWFSTGDNREDLWHPAASGPVYLQRSKSASADNSTPAQMQPTFAPFPGRGPHRSSAVLWLRVSRAGVFAQRRPVYLARQVQEVCPHATVLNVGCFGGTSWASHHCLPGLHPAPPGHLCIPKPSLFPGLGCPRSSTCCDVEWVGLGVLSAWTEEHSKAAAARTDLSPSCASTCPLLLSGL